MPSTPKPKRVVLSPAAELRARILEAVDLYERVVDVPEWECKILLRSPTAMDRYEWLTWLWAHEDELAADQAKDQAAKSALSLVLVACHPDTREKLFRPDDVWMLVEKNAAVVQRLVNEATTTMLTGSKESVHESETVATGITGPEVSDAASGTTGENAA